MDTGAMRNKLYMAMNLVEDYGYDIYNPKTGSMIGDNWDEAGGAILKEIKAMKLRDARMQLVEYQKEANKVMAKLQDKINLLEVE